MAALQFIAIGWTLTFMIPFILWNVLLIWFIEDESPGYAFISTFVFIALIQFCSDFNFFNWINLNTGSLIKWGLSYIGIGVVYSILKYVMYLTDKRRSFDKKFNKYLRHENLDSSITMDTLPENHKRRCYEHMKYNKLPDLYSSTKYVIFWMGYWPWSAFWTLLNNPLKWLYEEIKEMLQGLYKKLYSKILGSRIDKMNEWANTDRDGNQINHSDPRNL